MKDLNTIAIESIKSSTVKSYLNKIGHKFNIKEQISLIFNSDMQLVEKEELFSSILENIDVTEDIKSELKQIINNFNNCKSTLNKNTIAFLLYDEDGEIICTNSFTKVHDYHVNKNAYKYVKVVDFELEDLNYNIIYELELNTDGNIIRFFPYATADYVPTKIEDNYVEIPNQFVIGDIVKIYNKKEKYVVVSDSNIPEHLKPNCDFIDSSLTVVPKSVFTNNSRSYKEQIEDIYRNRIKHIEYSEPIIDIISREHEHINLTIIEKV